MDIIAELTSIVGADAVLNAADDMAPFLSDWHSRFAGQAHAVVLPQTTAQVAKIMEFASKQGIVVVPQGGNTGFRGRCHTRCTGQQHSSVTAPDEPNS